MSKTRTVAGIVPALRTTEGGGVIVRRAFPTGRLDQVDPFLLFDHMGPWDIAPGDAKGFPDHPHRGFETVTYLLEGQFEHRDSFGNHGKLEAGDVQWMTAGSGLVHSEMPGADLVRKGGRVQGFQIWVNLPKASKMEPPRYQELKAAMVPKAESNGVTVRVVAGEALGLKGAVETHVPITYVHATLQPGASYSQPLPAEQNAVAYVISGEAAFDGSKAGEGKLAVFEHDGDEVTIANAGDKPVDVLVLGGRPLNEPVARYGPFVMNTQEEIYQAFEDFRRGKMGVIR
jgi:redox-sensitive bicupin YhaK (pirin superfamily)